MSGGEGEEARYCEYTQTTTTDVCCSRRLVMSARHLIFLFCLAFPPTRVSLSHLFSSLGRDDGDDSRDDDELMWKKVKSLGRQTQTQTQHDDTPRQSELALTLNDDEHAEF